MVSYSFGWYGFGTMRFIITTAPSLLAKFFLPILATIASVSGTHCKPAKYTGRHTCSWKLAVILFKVASELYRVIIWSFESSVFAMVFASETALFNRHLESSHPCDLPVISCVPTLLRPFRVQALNVRELPSPLLSILDHFLWREDSQERVIGTCLGHGVNEIEVRNCFAVLHNETAEQVAVDMDYHRTMFDLHKVNKGGHSRTVSLLNLLSKFIQSRIVL